MNFSMVFYVLGWLLDFEAMFMLPSIITGIIYHEQAVLSLLASMLACLVPGVFVFFFKPKDKKIYAREGYAITALAWIVLSIFGAIPFVLSGSIPGFIDAVFETASGFTTTGASILTNVEAVPHCILFWRSFTHWVGGMGVIVFMIAFLPLAGGSEMFLMKAESPGPSVSKLVPKVKTTALTLYKLYIWLTIVEIVILLLGHMPLFDTLCITFGTAGTGGFSVLNSGCADYTAFQQIVITIFMIMFGVNFNFYYYVSRKRLKDAMHISEVFVYLGIIAASIAMITVNISSLYSSRGTALKDAAFQVGSIITTTGFATTDFNLWPSFSKALLVTLMFVGACAGSTGGGLKVSRVQILCKSVVKEVYFLTHPHTIRKVTMDGRQVEHTVRRSVLTYLSAYMVVVVFSVLLVSLDNFDLETSFTAVAATLNNIGPGLGKVGPSANFSSLSGLSKIVLTFDMIAGRLELFPVFSLFAPSTWRKS